MRHVFPEAEAEQGVAPLIVMPVVPRVDRRRYVTKRDLVKYGHTDGCQACTQLASGMHNAKVPHDDRCRDRIGELMAGDDDLRQVERMMSRTTVESKMKFRVQKLEKRWTLVNHRSSHGQLMKISHDRNHSSVFFLCYIFYLLFSLFF